MHRHVDDGALEGLSCLVVALISGGGGGGMMLPLGTGAAGRPAGAAAFLAAAFFAGALP